MGVVIAVLAAVVWRQAAAPTPLQPAAQAPGAAAAVPAVTAPVPAPTMPAPVPVAVTQGPAAPLPAPAPVSAPAPAPASVPASASVPVPVPVPIPAPVATPPAPAVPKAPKPPVVADRTHDAAPRTEAPAAAPPAGKEADGPAREEPAQALRDLPEPIRRAVPPVAMSGYMYSPNPADRLILVDKVLRREGDEVAPGLVLERLEPKGAVFVFRGYRFRMPY